MAEPPAVRPVIVGGMPRSGTTLLRRLLNTADELFLYPEMNPARLPSLFPFLDELRGFLGRKRLHVGPEVIDARISHLLRTVLATGLRRRDDLADHPRYGFKQPNAELHHEAFARALGTCRPRWVLTVRDPVAVYSSNLTWSNHGDRSPEAFLEQQVRSAQAGLGIDPADRFVVDIDTLTDDPDTRPARVAALFGFLDLPVGSVTEKFVLEWPSTNRSGDARRSDLTDAVVAERTEAFTKLDRTALTRATDALHPT